jgi:hydrogenase maturation protease
LLTALAGPGLKRAIVVDAAELGLRPGMWLRFPADGVRLAFRHLRGRHTHGGGLAEALALRDALGMTSLDVVVYGIQPEQTGYVFGLSPAVQTAAEEVCAAIQAELRPLDDVAAGAGLARLENYQEDRAHISDQKVYD